VKETVFIGGIPGSGKTTACGYLASLLGSRAIVVHVGSIACTLGDVHGLTNETIEQTPMAALDALQDLIAAEIRVIVSNGPHEAVFLLDGHFTLRGSVERPVYCIASRFFPAAKIGRLVLCTPSAADIKQRVVRDRLRRRIPLSSSVLAAALEDERHHAERISTDWHLPLIRITGARELTASEWLVRVLGKEAE
jgi:adenylate kinase